jgi:beta-fructofuranosidase
VPLRLPDKWVWDFWLAREGDRHHVFFLQAPRALGDPELRHWSASIGHAVSADLSTWTVLADAIRPGPAGAWDDLATWTGSVLEHDGRWHMLYTGISTREDGLVQRIGLATSEDLATWTKHPANPVLESDARWYEQLDRTRWRDQSWRDPWLFAGDDGLVHALITSRSPDGPADGAGVVAHARSANLVDWEVLPPLTAPGEFAQVEVPQLVRVGGRSLIFVSCHAEDHSRARRARLGADVGAGTHVFAAADVDGPYAALAIAVGPASPQPAQLYAAKLVELAPGEWRLMAFRGDPLAHDAAFAGELTDPLPLAADALALLEPSTREIHGSVA